MSSNTNVIVRVEIKNCSAIGIVIDEGKCLYRTKDYPETHSSHAAFDAQKWAEKSGHVVIDNVGVFVG